MCKARVGMMFFPALIAATLLLLPGGAVAGGKKEEGPIPIKQNEKKKSKNDQSIFPIVIGEPGSYKLVSNLDVTLDLTSGPDTDAIQIMADNVTLDLNGFQINGATTCMGSPVTSCDPTGEVEGGSGIDSCAMEECVRNTTVRNGAVRGMAGQGLRLGDGARVEGVRAQENGAGGIEAGKSSVVGHSHAESNASFGISVGEGSQLNYNTATGNGGPGAAAGDASVVHGNVTTGNVTGFFLHDNVGYEGNVASLNDTNVDVAPSSDAIEIGKNVCGTNSDCP